PAFHADLPKLLVRPGDDERPRLARTGPGADERDDRASPLQGQRLFRGGGGHAEFALQHGHRLDEADRRLRPRRRRRLPEDAQSLAPKLRGQAARRPRPRGGPRAARQATRRGRMTPSPASVARYRVAADVAAACPTVLGEEIALTGSMARGDADEDS